MDSERLESISERLEEAHYRAGVSQLSKELAELSPTGFYKGASAKKHGEIQAFWEKEIRAFQRDLRRYLESDQRTAKAWQGRLEHTKLTGGRHFILSIPEMEMKL